MSRRLTLRDPHRVLSSCEKVSPQKSHTIPTFILGIHCQALSMLRTSKPCTAEFPDLVRLKAVEPANIRPVPTRSNKAQNARLRSKQKKTAHESEKKQIICFLFFCAELQNVYVFYKLLKNLSNIQTIHFFCNCQSKRFYFAQEQRWQTPQNGVSRSPAAKRRWA